MTLPGANSNRWNIQSLGGTLWIDSLAFNGLLSRPGNWRFMANSRVEELAVGSSLLPDALHVKTGVIVASSQSLDAANCNLTCLDASLDVSGQVTGYMTEPQAADFTFRGEIGAKASDWIANFSHLPRDLRVRPPLSSPQTHVIWARKAPTRLSSVFRVPE